MPPTAAMTIRNPVRLRERCGVTTAEKRAGSGATKSAEGSLRVVMEVQYRSNMGRKTNPTAAKLKQGKVSPRVRPKQRSEPAPRPKAKAAPKPKAWTEAEIEEAFRRL